jgi:hypothetical protein
MLLDYFDVFLLLKISIFFERSMALLAFCWRKLSTAFFFYAKFALSFSTSFCSRAGVSFPEIFDDDFLATLRATGFEVYFCGLMIRVLGIDTLTYFASREF